MLLYLPSNVDGTTVISTTWYECLLNTVDDIENSISSKTTGAGTTETIMPFSDDKHYGFAKVTTTTNATVIYPLGKLKFGTQMAIRTSGVPTPRVKAITYADGKISLATHAPYPAVTGLLTMLVVSTGVNNSVIYKNSGTTLEATLPDSFIKDITYNKISNVKCYVYHGDRTLNGNGSGMLSEAVQFVVELGQRASLLTGTIIDNVSSYEDLVINTDYDPQNLKFYNMDGDLLYEGTNTIPKENLHPSEKYIAKVDNGVNTTEFTVTTFDDAYVYPASYQPDFSYSAYEVPTEPIKPGIYEQHSNGIIIAENTDHTFTAMEIPSGRIIKTCDLSGIDSTSEFEITFVTGFAKTGIIHINNGGTVDAFYIEELKSTLIANDVYLPMSTVDGEQLLYSKPVRYYGSHYFLSDIHLKMYKQGATSATISDVYEHGLTLSPYASLVTNEFYRAYLVSDNVVYLNEDIRGNGWQQAFLFTKPTADWELRSVIDTGNDMIIVVGTTASLSINLETKEQQTLPDIENRVLVRGTNGGFYAIDNACLNYH